MRKQYFSLKEIKIYSSFKVHRRLLNDDGLGVNEALNEYEFDQPVVARGQFILTFANAVDSAAKSLAHRKLVAPLAFVGETNVTLKKFQENFNFTVSRTENKYVLISCSLVFRHFQRITSKCETFNFRTMERKHFTPKTRAYLRRRRTLRLLTKD